MISNNNVCLLPWDSKFFGFSVAQVTKERLTTEDMNRVLKFCREYHVKLIQFKCDAHDRQSIVLAERCGFHFADMRMIYTRKTSNVTPPPKRLPKTVFRPAEEHDIEPLMAIAEDLYLHSRYYFDTNFPRDRVRDFYRDWVRKAVRGQFDDIAWVLCVGVTPVAFCTARLDGVAATIGLVGVHPNFAGQGFGTSLMAYTLSELQRVNIEHVSIITQGRNYQAQRLYQRSGFFVNKTQIYYHGWSHDIVVRS